jgi:hypothetical protein
MSESRIAELEEENIRLRTMLALNVAGHRLYSDDGALQDATELPFIDFKRDTAEEINAKIYQRGLNKLKNNAAIESEKSK